MRTLEIIPGLTVDDTMFETAADGIARLAPTLGPLTYADFTDPRTWSNIPDDQGELSKSEKTLTRTAELTLRLNVWYREDLRGSGAPMPHNHPWETFTGNLLMGGYDEDRWTLTDPGNVIENLDVHHGAPAANIVDHRTYHEVRGVHAPGRTMSLMVCGRGRRGDWGYLDVVTGEHRKLQPVTNFDAMYAALNPHQR